MMINLNSGHIYAQDAEICLRFGTYLFMGCINLPQIQSIFMHGKHKPASYLRDIYARGVETCLSFRSYLCTVSRNPPQIQDIFMHGVQKLALDLRHIYARCA